MHVYLLTEANEGVLNDSHAAEVIEDILNSGAVYATLEGAQEAAAASMKEWALEAVLAIEWIPNNHAENANEWTFDTDASGDTIYYLIRKVEVL